MKEATVKVKKNSGNRINNGVLEIKSNYQVIQIRTVDILFVKALSDYVIIETTNGKFITLSTMKEMLKLLPANLFIRVHRSYIVNLEKVLTHKGPSIYINKDKTKHTIPVGRSYIIDAKKKLDAFL